MAVADWALITEDEYRERYSAGGSGQVGNIQAAINSATAAIEARADRLFVSRGPFTEYHSLRYGSRATDLFVSEWPIISVECYEDTAHPRAYPVGSLLVAGASYEVIHPDRIRRLSGGGYSYWGTGARVVRNVLTAGYADTGAVPDDLKQAAFYVSAAIFTENTRRQWGVSGASDATGSWQRFTGYFTPAIDEMLAPYRRREVGRTWEKAA